MTDRDPGMLNPYENPSEISEEELALSMAEDAAEDDWLTELGVHQPPRRPIPEPRPNDFEGAKKIGLIMHGTGPADERMDKICKVFGWNPKEMRDRILAREGEEWFRNKGMSLEW